MTVVTRSLTIEDQKGTNLRLHILLTSVHDQFAPGMCFISLYSLHPSDASLKIMLTVI